MSITGKRPQRAGRSLLTIPLQPWYKREKVRERLLPKNKSINKQTALFVHLFPGSAESSASSSLFHLSSIVNSISKDEKINLGNSVSKIWVSARAWNIKLPLFISEFPRYSGILLSVCAQQGQQICTYFIRMRKFRLIYFISRRTQRLYANVVFKYLYITDQGNKILLLQ